MAFIRHEQPTGITRIEYAAQNLPVFCKDFISIFNDK